MSEYVTYSDMHCPNMLHIEAHVKPPPQGGFFRVFFVKVRPIFSQWTYEAIKFFLNSLEVVLKVSKKILEIFHFFENFTQTFVGCLPKSLILALCDAKGQNQ